MMNITIDNFENHVSFEILARGLAYFEEGAVLNLEELDDGEWVADVEGTDLYKVEVSIDDDGSVMWDCDCPYDIGPICKHVVAVLLAIKEERKKQKKSAFSDRNHKVSLNKMKKDSEDAVIVKEKQAPGDFERLLSLVKKEELVEFAKNYAQKQPQFQEDLSSFIRNIYVPSHSVRTKDYRKEVRKAFQHVSYCGRSRYNYDGMNNWFAIFNDIGKLFKEAKLLLKAGSAEATLDIAIQFLLSLDEEFDESLIYDDDIYVTEYCEEAEEMIMEAIEQPSVSEAYKMKMLKELGTITSDSGMCNYYDFDINNLVLQLTIKTQSDVKALELINENIRNYTKSYGLHQFVIDKINLLRKMNLMDEARQTIEENLHLAEIRRIAVDEAVMENHLDKAISLITDGIAIAQKGQHVGTERNWMEQLLQIYELQNDIAAQIAMCRQLFVLEHGSIRYYQRLKKLISESEWKPYLQQLLNETKIHDLGFGHCTLADIYVEEKDWDALFKWVIESHYSRLDVLDTYSCFLPESFSQQLLDIYTEELRQYASKNVGRNYYERINKAMICMQKLQGGKAQTILLASEFRLKYKNRPAMMETLKRF